VALQLQLAIRELSVSLPSTARTDFTDYVDGTTTRTPADRWILAGIAIAVTTIIAGIASTGVNLRYFLQPTAAWIVMGGTLGVTLITTPRNSLLHAARRVLGLLRQPAIDRETLAEEIVVCVRTARVQGLLAVEPRIGQVSNAFLREMLTLAIDVKNRGEFQATLETKLRLRERQGDADAKVLEVAGGFAPAIGVIDRCAPPILQYEFGGFRYWHRICFDHVRAGAGQFASPSRGPPDTRQRGGSVRDRRDDCRGRAVPDRRHSSIAGSRTPELLPA
jgi:hypothetical protein